MRFLLTTVIACFISFIISTTVSAQTTEKEQEKEIEAMMNEWIGLSKKQLLLNSGAPTSTYPDGEGGEILTYEKSRSAYMHFTERYLTVVQYYIFYVDKDQKIYHWSWKKESK